jgi:hypothetical protein
MTRQLLMEDVIIFLALCLVLFKAGDTWVGHMDTANSVNLKYKVWRFRSFSIILLIYLMAVGIFHQMGYLSTLVSLSLFALVLIPVFVFRKWILRRWIMRQTDHPN